jgi:hypothetical protein
MINFGARRLLGPSLVSQIRSFDRALACWRSLHDLADPAQRAAYERGIETWRWLVLLDPWAGPRVCMAALFAASPHAASVLIDIGLPQAELDHVLGLIARDEDSSLRDERLLLEQAIRRADEVAARRGGVLPRLAKVSGTFASRQPANDRRRDGTG